MEFDPAGKPVGITRHAFRVDDDGISTNWVEFSGGNLATACLQLATVRVARNSHRVGVANVGLAIETGKENEKEVKAVHDPIEPPDRSNPGHALLIGAASSDLQLLDELALLFELHFFTAEALSQSKMLHK